MQLAGKLDQYDFAHLLQMLASSGKSGKLTLAEYGGQGVIVFRGGRIIYAASNSPRETLGNMLLCKGLIDEKQLKQGLDRQLRSEKERRLGAILVELGFVSQEDLDEMMAAQIEKVVSEFLAWHTGFFRFEVFELPDRGEVEVDARLLQGRPGDLLREGVPTSRLLLDLADRLDATSAAKAGGVEEAEPTSAVAGEAEVGGDRAVNEPEDPREGREEHAAEEDSESSEVVSGRVEASAAGTSEPAAPDDGRFHSLKSIMVEFHSPAFTGEGTFMILNYAQRLVRRGVLFAISEEGARGLGQFGVEPPDGSTPDFIRRLTLPAGEPSILTEVMARKCVYSGPLEETDTNRLLLEKLGGGWPEAVVASPLIVGGRTLLVFYGDNLPENDPIGPVDELEIVMIHAALAMEKSLLAKRIEHLETLTGRSDHA